MHLNGLLTPAGGTVRIGDTPVTKGRCPTSGKTVGMVFQDPDDQLFMPTVDEDVGFGPINLGLPPEDVERARRRRARPRGRAAPEGAPALPALGRREARGRDRDRARHVARASW